MSEPVTAGPALPDVTLVVFSCTGRSHLLEATMASIRRQCPVRYAEVILAHDGEMDPSALAAVGADRLVQSCHRRGYAQSILQAFALIRTPYYLWLEDDWTFTRPADLPAMREILSRHSDWVQLRLSKVAPLADEERLAPLAEPGCHSSGAGFSANPHLGRTNHLQAGLAAFCGSPRTVENTFEYFLANWFKERRLTCAVIDPGQSAPIAHTGYLESTGRQWHAAAALDGQPATYASGLVHAGRPPLWRRMLLAVRLVAVAVRTAGRALRHPQAYDLGFRFINLSRHRED